MFHVKKFDVINKELNLYTPNQRIALKKENGPQCNCCGDYFYDENLDVNTKALNVHHEDPAADGGENLDANAMVLCEGCHRKLHYFIDCFRIYCVIDYHLLTVVFIHFFAFAPTDVFKKKYAYTDYATDLQGLANIFWQYVFSGPTLQQSVFMVYYKYATMNKRLKKEIYNSNFKFEYIQVVKSFKLLKKEKSPETNSFIGVYSKLLDKIQKKTKKDRKQAA